MLWNIELNGHMSQRLSRDQYLSLIKNNTRKAFTCISLSFNKDTAAASFGLGLSKSIISSMEDIQDDEGANNDTTVEQLE